MATHNRSVSADNSRGYILVHYDWYELEDEMDPLRRNAIVSTLNPDAFHLPSNAQFVKRGYQVRGRLCTGYVSARCSLIV